MKAARAAVAVVGLALILGLANWDILQKRAIVANGKALLLALQPADPRSLFQGDYMALALDNAAMPDPDTISRLPYRGTVILSLDENGVGRFARLDDGGEPAAGEMRVRFRRHEDWRGPRLDYGAQAFFFQEEDADLYEAAKFALLRVAADGSTILTDLADKDRVTIKPH